MGSTRGAHRRRPGLLLLWGGVVLVSAMPVARGDCGEKPVSRTVVYYFHRTIRCPSCNLLEYLTKAAVEVGFPQALESGELELAVKNVDEDENAHFIDDYGLTAQSVILSRQGNGKEERWKNLEKVWDLLHQEEAFMAYVQEEIRRFTSPPPVRSSREEAGDTGRGGER